MNFKGALLIAAVLVAPAAMARAPARAGGAEYFLRLDGLPGVSAFKGQPGWIAVKGFTLKSVAAAAGAAAYSAAATAPSPNEALLTRPIDASSPLLSEAAAKGTKFAHGEIEVVRPSGEQLTFLLDDVTIAKVASDGAWESDDLRFSAIRSGEGSER
ncbi:MAG: type VI secretion system tube protein Hcp [Caulobacteraceae bacterium]